MKNIKPVAKEDKSVAVIIPYYNGSKYIERSVKSVFAQTIKADELVVVNDGSTPEEAEFLDQISKKMGFTVYHKENGGQGSARNYGVARTKSQFITFLDQDDYYLDNHIEILLNEVNWEDTHFGWAYGEAYEADDNGYILAHNLVSRLSEDNHPKTSVYSMIRFDAVILPSASLISRKAFEDVGGFDAQFTGYEDDDLFMRLFRNNWNNYFTSRPVYVWCTNSNSTLYSIKMSRSRLRYVKKICETFIEDPTMSRYYIRDCLFPRFFKQFLKEARSAVARPKSAQQIKMFEHRDEIIDIFFEFIKTINNATTLDKQTRKKINKNILKIKIKRKWNSFFNQ